MFEDASATENDAQESATYGGKELKNSIGKPHRSGSDIEEDAEDKQPRTSHHHHSVSHHTLIHLLAFSEASLRSSSETRGPNGQKF